MWLSKSVFSNHYSFRLCYELNMCHYVPTGTLLYNNPNNSHKKRINYFIIQPPCFQRMWWCSRKFEMFILVRNYEISVRRYSKEDRIDGCFSFISLLLYVSNLLHTSEGIKEISNSFSFSKEFSFILLKSEWCKLRSFIDICREVE